MRTPAGTECPYYYEDFHRGRQTQRCDLIENTPNGGRWSPDLCAGCAVPRIVRANGCPNLLLEARVSRSLLGLRRSVEVHASCLRTLETVEEPQLGCGHCHEALPNVTLPPEA